MGDVDESVYWNRAMKRRTTSIANGRMHGLGESNSLYSRLAELIVPRAWWEAGRYSVQHLNCLPERKGKVLDAESKVLHKSTVYF